MLCAGAAAQGRTRGLNFFVWNFAWDRLASRLYAATATPFRTWRYQLIIRYYYEYFRENWMIALYKHCIVYLFMLVSSGNRALEFMSFPLTYRCDDNTRFLFGFLADNTRVRMSPNQQASLPPYPTWYVHCGKDTHLNGELFSDWRYPILINCD